MKASLTSLAAGVSRRRFLTSTAQAATVVSVVPAAVLGRAGEVAPNSRLNVAFIGVGSQGLRVMLNFLKHPDVQGVAVCDPWQRCEVSPQWGQNEYRNGVQRLLGVSTGWDWLSPNTPMIPLTRTSKVPAGVAGTEPCQKIIDAQNAARSGKESSRGCKAYRNFRELLAQEKDFDAVVVGTTDHVHAPVSIAAMRAGKHVYCQKPMTHTLKEARRMAEVARETRVATQVAVGPAASEETRLLQEWIGAGAIGPVREVINWSNRPVWWQALERPTETQPVPAGFDWDLWLGPSPARPYHSIYQPFVWRGWHDFGCGALGDMGCYSFDTIYRVLKLGAPVSVQASSSDRFAETYSAASIIHLEFPQRGELPPVRLTWYDGGLLPARPVQLDSSLELEKEGLLFIGERGSILCEFTGSKPRLIPEARMKAFQPPPKTLPRSVGHEREWLDAAKGGKDKPAANFEFSSVVTEGLLLGNVAVRSGGKRLLWDSAGFRVTNVAEANALLSMEYRAGWTL